MKQILVICGPTATGKTSTAFLMAKKFNGEIVSADSRQVYRHMNIGTGKEWDHSLVIWGYDLIDPQENFSVFDYFKLMKDAIIDIWSRNKLPIIVGGTGLYIKSLIDGIATVDIPKNINLRISLENMKTDELYDKLAILDGSRAAKLNSSDKRNPRRLIRAIEIAMWNTENGKSRLLVEKRNEILDKNVSTLFIGLSASVDILSDRIYKRVERRMNEGFIDEVENLLKIGVSWKHQSMNALGYKDAEAFFKKGTTYEDFINLWGNHELQYAKRQMTWFKKETHHNGKKRINWFDISDNKYINKVDILVKKWYSSSNNAKKN